MTRKNLTTLRREYATAGLSEQEAGTDPLRLFGRWLEQAMESGLPEPNALTLATVDAGGHPSARVLLLKELDEKGFVFYTNYRSDKGRELECNPHAALVFLWLELARQVRVQGRVEKLGEAESDAYFALRPRDSRLGALASPQSQVIPSREFLEASFRSMQKEYGNGPIPRPPHWGGYRLLPLRIEFWQGRPNRLHDRILFTREDKNWRISRLAP